MTQETDAEGPVVDLGWIFDGPIQAVIRANVMAAGEFVEFLSKYGFYGSSDDPGKMLGELRMASFSFEQIDASGVPVKRIFRIPWLSLLPLPLLEVKDATFKFGVRVLAAIPSNTPHRGMRLLRDANGEDDGDDVDPPPIEWRAMLASGGARRGGDKNPDLTPHLAANLDAKVTVGQADIPAGIRNLLALMGENAQVTQALLTAQPTTLSISYDAANAGAGEPPTSGRVQLTTLAGARGADVPPRISVLYDTNLVWLATIEGAELLAWPSGAVRSTDKDGSLTTYVLATPGAQAATAPTPILFRTEIEGAGAEAEVSYSIVEPTIAGGP